MYSIYLEKKNNIQYNVMQIQKNIALLQTVCIVKKKPKILQKIRLWIF